MSRLPYRPAPVLRTYHSRHASSVQRGTPSARFGWPRPPQTAALRGDPTAGRGSTMRRAPSIRGMGARKGGALSRPRSLIALFASAAVLAGVAFGARAQTYTVVLSVNDSRPMGQAVLSLI